MGVANCKEKSIDSKDYSIPLQYIFVRFGLQSSYFGLNRILNQHLCFLKKSLKPPNTVGNRERKMSNAEVSKGFISRIAMLVNGVFISSMNFSFLFQDIPISLAPTEDLGGDAYNFTEITSNRIKDKECLAAPGPGDQQPVSSSSADKVDGSDDAVEEENDESERSNEVLSLEVHSASYIAIPAADVDSFLNRVHLTRDSLPIS